MQKIRVKKDIEYSILKKEGFKPRYDMFTGKLNKFVYNIKIHNSIIVNVDTLEVADDVYSDDIALLVKKTIDLINKGVFEIR